MSDLTVMNQQHPSTMNTVAMLFSSNDGLDKIMRFADLMASGAATVPKHLQGKPSDCMAITMQSLRWGMDPFVVGQKTHLINGVLGYEAQLVNAVVTSSNAVQGRFHYDYGDGDWSKIVGKEMDKRDESGLYIRVGAVLRGENEITWGENIYLADITTRNSPLWKTNPKQQMAYLGVKYWARLYCPEVILGVYTPDEVEQRTERDVTPPAQRVSISQMSSDQANVVAEQPTLNEGAKQEAPVIDATSGSDEANFNYEALAAEFRESIDKLQTLDSAKNLRVEIEEIKQQLGSALYTELKGKAVKKYHQIDARNYIEAAINSLDLGSASRVADFAKVEQDLKARKSKLGDDLFDGYTLTLDDLRVEFS